MPKVKDETRYKRKVRSRWEEQGLWSEAYEPAMGSGTGYPDIQFLSPRKVLLPAELKVGEIKGDRVFPREVRGDQVVWERNFRRHGGLSIMMIGVEDKLHPGHWDTFAVPGERMEYWKQGYPVAETYELEGTLGPSLVKMVQFFLKEAPISALVDAV